MLKYFSLFYNNSYIIYKTFALKKIVLISSQVNIKEFVVVAKKIRAKVEAYKILGQKNKVVDY